MMRIPHLPAARAVSAALAVVALLVAAGCGSSDDSKDSGTGTRTLTVWHNYVTDSQFELLDKQAALFEAKHPGVEVKYAYLPYTQLSQKLIASAPARTGPDVVLHPGDVEQLQNAIADMTECISTWPTADELVPVAKKDVGDRTYGLLPYGNLIALWYNKTLLDEHGVKPPTTIDELEQALETVTAGGDQGLTMSAAPTFEAAWTTYPFFTAYGVTFPDVDQPATSEVFALLARWADEGWVPRNVSTLDQATVMQKFLTGKFAFAVNGNWEINHMKDAAKFEYGVVTLPAGDEPARSYISGEVAMIGKFSKEPELACDYLGESWFSEAGQRTSIEINTSMPMLSSLESDPLLTDDPVLGVFAEQARTTDAVPGGDVYVANGTVWGPAVSAAFAGTDPPEEISSKAVAEVDEVVADGGEQ